MCVSLPLMSTCSWQITSGDQVRHSQTTSSSTHLMTTVDGGVSIATGRKCSWVFRTKSYSETEEEFYSQKNLKDSKCNSVDLHSSSSGCGSSRLQPTHGFLHVESESLQTNFIYSRFCSEQQQSECLNMDMGSRAGSTFKITFNNNETFLKV